MGSLPHVAGQARIGPAGLIIAFGSSSTAGYGSTTPEYTYPNRPRGAAAPAVSGRGNHRAQPRQGGEDAPEMMKRLQTQVIDMKPDLVIWQVGTNAVLRNLDPSETANWSKTASARVQAAWLRHRAGRSQYSPRINERAESAGQMVQLLRKVAELRHVGIFPRFEVIARLA